MIWEMASVLLLIPSDCSHMTGQESPSVWGVVSRRCVKRDVKLGLMSWLREAVTAWGEGVESSCLFLPLLASFPSPNKVLVNIAQLSTGHGWISAEGGGGMGTASCAWSSPSLLLLLERFQLPLSLCLASCFHKKVTRPCCVGPALTHGWEMVVPFDVISQEILAAE